MLGTFRELISVTISCKIRNGCIVEDLYDYTYVMIDFKWYYQQLEPCLVLYKQTSLFRSSSWWYMVSATSVLMIFCP
jgi:hypothetical protein